MSTPSPVGVWVSAARPKTLPAACAPVLVGCAVAAHAGVLAAGPALAALVGALLLQIGANFANDYYDFLKGADGPDRLGPTRATQAGWVTPAAMRRATISVFVLATIVGAYLVTIGGWPILLAGVLAVVTAVAYTGGPWPLAYLGLGEVAAFAFFGPVAVVGTAYVQSHALTPLAAALAVGPGMLSAALLGVNNLRDRSTDERAGKRTLAVRFGARAARVLYALELTVAFAVPVGLVLAGGVGPGALAALGALPFVVPPARLVATQEGAPLNGALAGTARLLLVYGLLLAAGVAWKG